MQIRTRFVGYKKNYVIYFNSSWTEENIKERKHYVVYIFSQFTLKKNIILTKGAKC